MNRIRMTALIAGLVALLAGSLAVTQGGASAGPSIPRPRSFVSVIDNEYFPLIPGTTFYYEGETDGTESSNVTYVTHQTRQVLGVTTTVVHDQAFEDGVLVEDTLDYYAQDRAGNVWYFGEDTKELDEQGNVISTEGTWLAGVSGARPGIIMPAEPERGMRYNQEVAPGVAEDKAQVLSENRRVCVEYGCFREVLLTKEWTPLQPGVVEHKYYAEGIGFILADMVRGGDEHTELVAITTE